ncbi:hypothetical protein roselon_02409 [Roseibacterium elongatum DSM 19469]|uniref:Uncharacterized protein n=1 Tax=Roseicyclus elongatus DSM 19469 TaxID=1294273 RepID=W8S720_9RHOB|nr:hypothetical protein [Roseibacterium elongatum]AHM04736.1 hypothetical protein roselon_02409 [Roseibacterium elongatum DSM 19469]
MTDNIQLDLTLEEAEKIVAYAMEAFDTTIEALRDTVQVLRSMPETGEREVIKDVKAMNNALMFTMEMQEKARAAGSKRFGTDRNGCKLDLDGARAEVEMRLACLRDAGGAGGVSGQPE